MKLVGKLFPVIAVILFTAIISTLSHSDFAVAEDNPRVHTVIISEFKFTPEALHVNPGDKIVWINQDIVPHTATAVDRSWDTGAIGTHERKEIVVTKTQTLDYFCFYHPMMTAQLLLN